MISIYVQILLIIFFWSTDCQIIPRIEECGLSCSQVIPCSNLLSINTVVICCQNNCRKKKKGKREKCFSCPEHSLIFLSFWIKYPKWQKWLWKGVGKCIFTPFATAAVSLKSVFFIWKNDFFHIHYFSTVNFYNSSGAKDMWEGGMRGFRNC